MRTIRVRPLRNQRGRSSSVLSGRLRARVITRALDRIRQRRTRPVVVPTTKTAGSGVTESVPCTEAADTYFRRAWLEIV